MNRIATCALLFSLAACASPDSPARLAAAGPANAPTREGTMPTTAAETKLTNGGGAWSVTCGTGRNYMPCESRARSLCPNGYTETSRKAERRKNSAGIQVQTVPTSQGTSVTGFIPNTDGLLRTIVVTCE